MTKLYPYQQRVFDHVTAGYNVIIQAPTGAGKTRAALYPFLYGLGKNRQSGFGKLPRKCIYSVPMRVLAKQFFNEYAAIIDNHNVKYGLDISKAIQTGDQANDPELRSNLIFATIDQTLSSFLIAPYSLPRRKANINAAAVMGAYLVFDEFHLYDPISTLPTTLEMLKILHGITPFVLMTATFSHDMLHGLAEILQAVVVPSDDDERRELEHIPSQQKERRYFVAEQPLDATAILNRHQRRSLVICNTVARAQALYEALIEQSERSTTEVILLHSRFLREDRDSIEDTIISRFNDESLSTIVLATQAIEVGVDISADVLHTELAPANAILQRAGRCARRQNEQGTVIIYPQVINPADGSIIDLCDHPAPYINQKEQFTAAITAFRERQGFVLGFCDEQDIISAVHGAADRKIIEELCSQGNTHRQSMYAVMDNLHQDTQNLVRNTFQQQVTIHPNPAMVQDSPFDVPSFGFHPYSLVSIVEEWLKRGNELDLDWQVKCLVSDDSDQSGRSSYRWEVVQTAKTIIGYPLIAVHPSLAAYDRQRGFLATQGGEFDTRFNLPAPEKRQEGWSHFTYRLETYQTHIKLVHEAFVELWSEMTDLAQRLERHFNWEEGSVLRATELAVLLHDVGKLSKAWQDWVRKYQASIGRPVDQGQAYAHTTLQTDEHRNLEKEAGKRPWHAVEGAVASIMVLHSVLGDHPLLYATFSAIARHHAPHSHENKPFTLSAKATTWVKQTLAQIQRYDALDLTLVDSTQQPDLQAQSAIVLANNTTDYGSYEGGFLAYALIVRILRLADQLGTQAGQG